MLEKLKERKMDINKPPYIPRKDSPVVISVCDHFNSYVFEIDERTPTEIGKSKSLLTISISREYLAKVLIREMKNRKSVISFEKKVDK